MPELIPIASSVIDANNKGAANRAAADLSRYSIDKNYDLGVLNNQLGKDTLQSNEKQAQLNREQQTALENLANEFTAGQLDTSRQAGSGYQSAGESQFLDSVNSAPPELQAAIDSIRQGSTLEQQQAQNQFHNNLESQGVRGPQAATLMNRGQGKLTADLSNNINQIALDEASKRSQAKSSFYNQKAQTGQAAAVR